MYPQYSSFSHPSIHTYHELSAVVVNVDVAVVDVACVDAVVDVAYVDAVVVVFNGYKFPSQPFEACVVVFSWKVIGLCYFYPLQVFPLPKLNKVLTYLNF